MFGKRNDSGCGEETSSAGRKDVRVEDFRRVGQNPHGDGEVGGQTGSSWEAGMWRTFPPGYHILLGAVPVLFLGLTWCLLQNTFCGQGCNIEGRHHGEAWREAETQAGDQQFPIMRPRKRAAIVVRATIPCAQLPTQGHVAGVHGTVCLWPANHTWPRLEDPVVLAHMPALRDLVLDPCPLFPVLISAL